MKFNMRETTGKEKMNSLDLDIQIRENTKKRNQKKFVTLDMVGIQKNIKEIITKMRNAVGLIRLYMI